MSGPPPPPPPPPPPHRPPFMGHPQGRPMANFAYGAPGMNGTQRYPSAFPSPASMYPPRPPPMPSAVPGGYNQQFNNNYGYNQPSYGGFYSNPRPASWQQSGYGNQRPRGPRVSQYVPVQVDENHVRCNNSLLYLLFVTWNPHFWFAPRISLYHFMWESWLTM